MALGRMPSVGLVSGRQLGVSSDDEPRGCAQCRKGSSFHHLGDSQSGIEDPVQVAIFFGSLGGLEIFCPGIVDDPASRRVPPFWNDQGVIMDLGLLGREDWSPEWSFMGETRYLNSLLDTLIWPESTGCQELVNLVRFLGPELFLEVIVMGIRLSRYDASCLDLESKGLWVLTTFGLA
ncbi:hypothetical protein HID58_070865 [Brassica napus]|uniref:Uncharacterized protein n=1 Tax=Brassica napus TaxID=3708 RepID=A0ABQ7Z011_BRANA|nr:hypothetical protein HID58_070865 [Brassica napus]